MPVPADYAERVYAGVLGKIIGVYLGRPIEGWSYERITSTLGEINYYVNEQLKAPLVVTDDDISGTFTFLRALSDYGNSRDITAEQIGQTWLNYLIENRTILWWGGMGNSTEHTAYLRLRQGIKAPESGSIAVNGKVVAEQIGSQIFIDGWGMVAPGDPSLATDFARRAASVSHDGEAIYGAQVVAALVAQAFVESDIDRLLDTAVSFIPKDSLIYRLIADIRAWHADEKDWRKTREKIAAQYGYDKYGGNCHMVPNHALIIHALLHGEGDFQKSLMIVNTCGWDTDCNSGNVGCILGVRNGLAGIDAGPDWRTLVADRLFLPTVDGGRGITDAATEAIRIVNIGHSLAGETALLPKMGARFHFYFPGSVQGFRTEEAPECKGAAEIENVVSPFDPTQRCLAIHYRQLAAGRSARVATPTFLGPEETKMAGYGIIASPTLYSGQLITARVMAAPTDTSAVLGRLYVSAYNEKDALVRFFSPPTLLQPASRNTLTWCVPDVHGYPIAEVGIEASGERGACGTLLLDSLTWDGVPNVIFGKPAGGSLWRNAWVNGVDHFDSPGGSEPFRLIQDHGTGLLSQGCREWSDYGIASTVTIHLAESAGIAVRVQGMERYYALLLVKGGRLRLVKALDGHSVLREVEFPWNFGQPFTLGLTAVANKLRATVDGRELFSVLDTNRPLMEGAVGFICTEGRVGAGALEVTAIRG